MTISEVRTKLLLIESALFVNRILPILPSLINHLLIKYMAANSCDGSFLSCPARFYSLGMIKKSTF